MKKFLASLGIGSTLVLGGVDASVLKETPINKTESIAGYEVKAEQKGNVVETTLPWKDQTGIKVKYDMGEPTLAEKVTDKRKQQVITETVTDFDGGFKVDILLNEKPSTNVFCYAIEGAENYDFFYQAPLTLDEIEEGSVRPPEIEGSYAVYHKTLANHRMGAENYATGKVMHIPRPQVWSLSDESTKEWADLSYDEGTGLCVTVPQDFLNKADYPVRVDPTFGYTTHGASQFSYAQGTVNINLVAGSLVASTGDTLTQYTLWGSNPGASNATLSLALANLVSEVVTNQQTLEKYIIVTSGSSDQEVSSITFSQSLTGGVNYCIGIDSSAISFSPIHIDYDSGSPPGRFSSTLTSLPGVGNSMSPTGVDSGRHYSIYASYTAGGGGGSSTTPNQNIILFD